MTVLYGSFTGLGDVVTYGFLAIAIVVSFYAVVMRTSKRLRRRSQLVGSQIFFREDAPRGWEPERR